MIVSSDEDTVPRGPRRQELNELGAIVHLVDFHKEWTEEEVRKAIESAFQVSSTLASHLQGTLASYPGI